MILRRREGGGLAQASFFLNFLHRFFKKNLKIPGGVVKISDHVIYERHLTIDQESQFPARNELEASYVHK